MKLKSLLFGLALGMVPFGAAAQQTQCVTNAQAGGTGDALTVPLLPCGLATNLMVLTLTATNATSTPTLQMVGYAALPIVNATGGALSAGQLASGTVVLLAGTGTQWRLEASGLTSGSSVNCSGLPALVGDVTTPGASCTTTLSTSGATAGTYGNSTAVAQFTVDAKGRITSATNVNISGLGQEPSIAQFTQTVAQPGFDPFFKATCVLSNSNKTCTPSSGGGYNQAYGTIARYAGKYYFEAQYTLVSGFAALGVASALGHQVNGQSQLASAGQMAWKATVSYGTLEFQNVTITTIQGFVTGDRLSVAVDLDNNLIWFRTNAGNWNNSGAANPATGVGGIDLRYAYSSAANHLLWPAVENGTTNAVSLYELAGDFTQSVPAGFSPWGP